MLAELRRPGADRARAWPTARPGTRPDGGVLGAVGYSTGSNTPIWCTWGRSSGCWGVSTGPPGTLWKSIRARHSSVVRSAHHDCHVGRQQLAVLAAGQVVLVAVVVDQVGPPDHLRPALELVGADDEAHDAAVAGALNTSAGPAVWPRLWLETRLTRSSACSMSVGAVPGRPRCAAAPPRSAGPHRSDAVEQRRQRGQGGDRRGREVDVRHGGPRRLVGRAATGTGCPTPPGPARRSRPCGSTRRPTPTRSRWSG